MSLFRASRQPKRDREQGQYERLMDELQEYPPHYLALGHEHREGAYEFIEDYSDEGDGAR